MKRPTLLFILLCSVNNLIGQDVFETWEELNDFNQIISEALIDAEQDSLESTRDLAQDIFEKASFLAESQVPEMYDFGTINDLVRQLKTESSNLFDLVENGKSNDKDLKEALLSLNRTFLSLIDLCKAENNP